MFFDEVKQLSTRLLRDEDDMVQKGLGWLLRETAKADPKRTVPYLMAIRDEAARASCCGQLARRWGMRIEIEFSPPRATTLGRPK